MIKIYNWKKYNYYEDKANQELQKQFNNIKNYDRNWWRFYYYESLANGYDHQTAFKEATKSLKEQRYLDEKLIKKLLKKNKNINKITKDDLNLLALELIFNKSKKGR